MEENELNDRSKASQLRHEDTEELALNLAMYAQVKPEKDPLDSSTTAEMALEPTPFFEQTAAALGYNPLKGEWSLETQKAQLEHTAALIRGVEEFPKSVIPRRRKNRGRTRGRRS